MTIGSVVRIARTSGCDMLVESLAAAYPTVVRKENSTKIIFMSNSS
jgi:hypothetical protein